MTGDAVNLTIDGRDASVAAGTNVVDAAREVGVDIPVFCHHPLLEPVGMCRMCLVEVGTPVVDRGSGDVQLGDDGLPVIRFFPQLVPGCTTEVSEGMVVRTDTDAVADVRRGVIELLLTSHPLDCPVCDKGGECPLQNQTMRYGPGRSRFEWSDKQRFEKPVALGPLITLDRERCVLCARCIRFQDEIAEDPVLGLASRGRGMEIISSSDPPFDSVFSGNTTDICPVGALTSTDFRFAARAWELVGVPGVCAHCPVGCNVMHDTRYGRILRVMPRRNDEVNEIWLCDKGRFAHAFASADDRLTTPLVRRGGELEAASWSDALAAAAEGLAAARERHGPTAIGGLSGGTSPNEDLYMFGRFMRAVLGTNNVDYRPSAVRDALPVEAGVPVGTRLTELGEGTVVVVVGLDVAEEAPVLLLNLLKARRRGARIVVVGGRPQKLDRFADATLRYRYGGEDAVLAALMRAVLGDDGTVVARQEAARLRGAVDPFTDDLLAGVHPVRPGDVADAAAVIGGARDLIVAYGRDAVAAGLAPALAAMLTATGHVGRPNNGLVAVGPEANSQGAADMGLLPDLLPGYRSVADDEARRALAGAWPREPLSEPGLDASAMLAGGVRALYVMGTDPGGDDPAVRAALKTLEFLVVQDLFLTDTARSADVVLPDVSVPERDGTMTSFTRRVQRFVGAAVPTGESRPGWRILGDLGLALGEQDTFSSADDVTADIARVVPGYGGLTPDALGGSAQPSTDRLLLPFAPKSEARAVTHHGTAYENELGVGSVWPQPGPQADAAEPVAADSERHEDEPGAGSTPPAVGAGAGLDWRPGDGRPCDGLVLVPTTLLYDAGELMRGAEILKPLVPEPHVLMSPFDAGPLGLDDGARVLVTSERGSLVTSLRVRDGLTPGTVLAPEDLGGSEGPRAVLGDEPWARVTVESAE